MARRITRAILTTAVLAAGFVVVPLPRLVWASEMATESTRPTPAPAGDAFVDPATALSADTATDQGAFATPAAGETSLVLDHDAEDFSTIGIGWDGEVQPASVIVRTRTAEVWTPWQHFVFSADHRPDDAPETATGEPLWVGSGDAYEIQFPSGLGEPTVHLVRETQTEVSLSLDDDTAGADPVIRSRSSWGARSPAVTPSTSATLEAAIVHHSVTSNSYSSAQVPGILRSIQAYHMDVQGWDDIAYNFAVDRFGQTWEARAGGIDRTVIGGHAYGFNVGTTGVLVIGSYESTVPTSASTTAAADLIAWKFAEHHVPLTGTVTMFPGVSTHHGPAGTPVAIDRIGGHRNTGQTSCPGRHLYDRLGTIRSGAAARLGGHQQSAPPVLIGGDRTGDDRDDALVYHPGSRGDHDLRGTSGPDLTVSATGVSGLYEPLEGDFDGDGVSDVFWYRPGPQSDYIWYGKQGGGHRNVATNIHGDYLARVGDFDGDDIDDILFYGDFGTSDHVFWGGAGGLTHQAFTINDHVNPLIGDFDGDGADDIFWYGWASRPDHMTWGRADRTIGFDPTSVSGGYEPFIGDFDDSGTSDIFWYAPGPGADSIWSGDATRTFSQSTTGVSGVYETIVGDYDGDGTDDVMWYAAGSAPDYIWFHEAGGRRSEARGVGGTYETLALDTDADGRDELLWVDSRNVAYLWSRTNVGAHVSSRVLI